MDEVKSFKRIWEIDLGFGRVNEVFWGGRFCDLMGVVFLGKGMSLFYLGGDVLLRM